MQLEHAFIVRATPEQTFDVLRDIARVAPMVPGATVSEVEGTRMRGKLRVKVGPGQITYRGTATVTAADAAAYAVTVELDAVEARGTGTARATILLGCGADEAGTRVQLLTELAVTGRAEAVEPTVLAEAAERLLQRFGRGISDVARELGEQDGTAPSEGAVDPGPAPADDLAAAIPPAASVVSLTRPAPIAPLASPTRAPTPASPGIDGGPGPSLPGSLAPRRTTPVVAVLAAVALILWLMRRS